MHTLLRLGKAKDGPLFKREMRHARLNTDFIQDEDHFACWRQVVRILPLRRAEHHVQTFLRITEIILRINVPRLGVEAGEGSQGRYLPIR